MAHYFRYRYQARNDPINNSAGLGYMKRGFYKKAIPEQEFLRDTQQHFIAILARVSSALDHIMKNEITYNTFIGQPFVALFQDMSSISDIRLGGRAPALTDYFDGDDRDKRVHKVQEQVIKWRQWLADHLSPDLIDADSPERDVLTLIDTLTDVPLAKEVVQFFDDLVHDSMAGLAKDKVNEFLVNGVGIAKFRRIYFGNRGDAMLHEAAAKINKQRKKATDALRAQRKQWDRESEGYRATRST